MLSYREQEMSKGTANSDKAYRAQADARGARS